MGEKWVIYVMNIVQLAIELTKSWGKILVNDLFENLVEIWQEKMVKQTICHYYSHSSRPG